MCYTRAALALNIVIGGSVGNVTADQFLTVQDNDLTTKVRHIKLPDFSLLKKFRQCQTSCNNATSAITVRLA